jgi:hypothetical protein
VRGVCGEAFVRGVCGEAFVRGVCGEAFVIGVCGGSVGVAGFITQMWRRIAADCRHLQIDPRDTD